MDIFYCNDKIFEFIYVEALRDAVLQLAYEGKKGWIGKEVPEAIKSAKKYITEILNNGFKNQEEHDKFFALAAREICEAINEKGKIKNPDYNNEFSFGNAQKLLNIVVKHMYGQCYTNPELRSHFKYCHCPMDSIMLEKVWKACEHLYNSKIERSNQLGEGLGNKSRDNFLKSWGKEDWEIDGTMPKRYQNFQKAVRKLAGRQRNEKGEALFPIEYDYFIWGQ